MADSTNTPSPDRGFARYVDTGGLPTTIGQYIPSPVWTDPTKPPPVRAPRSTD
jgi:hypothetical protein